MKIRFVTLFGVALGLTACSHAPTTAEQMSPSVQAIEHRAPAAQRLATLPDQASWQALYDYTDSLDLTAVDLALHTGNGTSVYGVISIGGKAVGAIIPEKNSSGSVTGETIAFTISRVLGVHDLYQPGVYKKLTGRNLEAFMRIVPRTPLTSKNGKLLKLKDENRKAILARYAKDPSYLDAVFKRWDERPRDVENISRNGLSLSPSFTVAGASAPIASLISCDGPRPNAARRVTFAGGSTDELSAAKQMSVILLIDAMTAQRDRFSGGNLQTVTKNGVAKFVSIDNGGTWGGDRWTARNLASVTRWEKSVADQILAMADYFERGIPYLGLRNDDEMMAAFDIAESPDDYRRFKKATLLTAAHIRQHPNCYF
jgi:hypothetical protein